MERLGTTSSEEEPLCTVCTSATSALSQCTVSLLCPCLEQEPELELKLLERGTVYWGGKGMWVGDVADMWEGEWAI